MFRNLSAELARKRMTIKDLSDVTGIPYETLKGKISGKTEFKLSEMLVIKRRVFPNLSTDYLFQTEEE